MDTPARPAKLQPDISTISESLRFLSDELPKLSQLDSTATLHVLHELREDLRHYAVVQDDLRKLLDGKLTRIQETLSSLEHRIGSQEYQTVSVLHAREDGNNIRTPIKGEHEGLSASLQSIMTYTSASSVSNNPNPVSLGHVQPSMFGMDEPWGLFRGVSGALSIMFVTLLPLYLALAYVEPE